MGRDGVGVGEVRPPPPPPGFVLDEAGDIPPPPAGFTLDGPAKLGGTMTGISSTPWYDKPLGSAGGIVGKMLDPSGRWVGEQGMLAGHGPSVREGLAALPALTGAVTGLALSETPWTAIGGATLGGSIGESGKEVLSHALGIPTGAPTTEGEVLKRHAVSAGEQGLTELAGLGLAAGVTKGLAPFAGSFERPLAEAAVRQGVEMPASALSRAKLVPLAEAVSAKGIGGGQTARRYSGATSHLTAMADQTAARASKLTDPGEIGRTISAGLDQFKGNWIRTKNALYAEAALPESGLKVQAKNTVDLLDSIIAEKEAAGKILGGAPGDTAVFRRLRDGLTQKESGATAASRPKGLFDEGDLDVALRSKLTVLKGNGRIDPGIPIYDDAGRRVATRGGVGRKEYAGINLPELEDIPAKRAAKAIQTDENNPTYVRIKEAVRNDWESRIERESMGSGADAEVSFDPVALEKQGPAKTGRPVAGVEARNLLAARRELNQRLAGSYADPFTAANKGALKKVAATMDEELTAAIGAQNPALAAKLADANRVYSEGIGKINSAFGKNIHKLSKAGQYDKIAQSVVNSRVSVEDIPRIMEVAGAEGTEGMRAAVLADLVSKAKGAGGELRPEGLSRAIKGFGEDRLQALLEPEQMAKLTDIANLSRSLQKGQKVTEGSQTAFVGRYLSEGAAALAHPVLAFKVLVGDVAFNRFVASKVGQRWLTTGFPLAPGVKAALRQAPRAGTTVYDVSQARPERQP